MILTLLRYCLLTITVLFAILQCGFTKETLIKIPVTTPINLSLLNEAKHSLKVANTYLLKTQMANGSWKDHPAITALVLYSFLLSPSNEQSSVAIQKGLDFIESFVQKDGGIYRKEYRNYVTAVCLMALAETGKDKYRK